MRKTKGELDGTAMAPSQRLVGAIAVDLQDSG
jgi:hypothetical protein